MEKTFTVTKETGIHARPATVLIQEASKFNCDIDIEYKNKKANSRLLQLIRQKPLEKAYISTFSRGH